VLLWKPVARFKSAIFLGNSGCVAVASFFGVRSTLGRGRPKETGNCNATAISEKSHRFKAGNWFPD
jgi:hypothetical protein